MQNNRVSREEEENEEEAQQERQSGSVGVDGGRRKDPARGREEVHKILSSWSKAS